MYEHIIVPFDGTSASTRAAMMGADLGATFGASLVVVTASVADTDATLLPLKQRAVEMSSQTVDIWVEAASSPAAAVATAQAHRPDSLVCMATHGRTGLRRALFGSVAEEVIRTIDVPVLLLGPDAEVSHAADIDQIILCLDATATSEAAVPLAGAWANALGVRCLVLNVIARDEPGQNPVELARFEQTLEKVCPVTSLALEAPSAMEGLIDVSREASGAVLVMATHGRTGYDRFSSGSVMADLVRESPVPLLVQRGDVTPGLTWLQDNVAD